MDAEDFSWDKVDAKFSSQMRLSGLNPSHRIAIAVSGGADSIALCLLIARWKRLTVQREGYARQGVGELFAYVVDHSLRKDSAEEALLVKEWALKLGFNCRILKCKWPNGKPSPGHLQEAARNARYSLLSQACIQSGVQALLTAHHANDQAELFILRLSRRSEIVGLAGMAFAADRHPVLSTMHCPARSSLVLVRPLLNFSKQELYVVCKQSGQAWVEDPTNANLTFARNRIRKALHEPEYLLLKKEVPKVIEFCRKMRFSIDRDRDFLLRDVARISHDLGNVTVDVQKLVSRGITDIVTHRAVAAILQFVAQRAKPPRGRVVEMLLDRLRLGSLQGACTVGGCYVFPLPGSKGSKAVFCFSPDSPPPSGILKSTTQELDSFLSPESCMWSGLGMPVHTHRSSVLSAAEPVVVEDTNLIGVAPEAVTMEKPPSRVKDFKLLGLISEDGAALLENLTSEMAIDTAKSSVEQTSESPCLMTTVGDRMMKRISSGQVLNYMDRFCVSLNHKATDISRTSDLNTAEEYCGFLRDGPLLYVRHYVDRDWQYLSDLAKGRSQEWGQGCNFACGELTGNATTGYPCREIKLCKTGHGEEKGTSIRNTRGLSILECNRDLLNVAQRKTSPMAGCQSYKVSKAREALEILKKFPKPIRRSLPVLTTAQGLLLVLPFAGFAHCKIFSFTARFCPRNPLGGGRASWH
ncbi:tRNA(Ile)-lysidine synthase [Marchantia polymorpha subsp. ruderalis]|uniref:tRNA(Ile)-lysidine synthetase n=2 Tax=Marchantia polymorpha TaxID=3197 RepID=A0AAF6BTY8_MARPO|nr:hypothetical protein MARPO_0045s0077 [Marchantia polymorpha]BBN15472.1 hypothetical protein Mp_6g19860 [Marchantia polymorpha subsp. ruderalis]|eukprot:PTQ39416.1 hypothetical protein MARPO_0045s0077 [Marchantia polymorpha]